MLRIKKQDKYSDYFFGGPTLNDFRYFELHIVCF